MSEKELSGWGIVLKPATTDDARRLQPHLHPEWPAVREKLLARIDH
ncbi:hypothetical protein GP475_01180 [Corynebacterium poyangense]|uniref:Uncharacterized protein n=1 Tax=Corynebacterium poyangense TaxID=2684405 RepID=A0A7H0SLG8_9CORY|nr:hypothetical protein [Corynebacterium poyangense]QNQ89393.1 hypothetical protein GP475_01180 [Corynebacterium poyangense]